MVFTHPSKGKNMNEQNCLIVSCVSLAHQSKTLLGEHASRIWVGFTRCKGDGGGLNVTWKPTARSMARGPKRQRFDAWAGRKGSI